MVDQVFQQRMIPPAVAENQGTGMRSIAGRRLTMWVLEDKFAAGRPAWEHADGVIFTDEVEKYEQVKLRLLNGSHSLISYLGALDGRDTIPASRSQDFVESCVRRAIEDECLPSIDLPSGFDPNRYVDDLFVRWTNFALGDLVARVGSDGSAKILQRTRPAMRLLKRVNAAANGTPGRVGSRAYVPKASNQVRSPAR